MNILVTIPMDEGQRSRLAAIAPMAQVTYCPQQSLTSEQVRGAEIILGNLPPELLEGAERLQWLQLNFAGSDNYCAPGLLGPEVVLTNATGAYGLAISECMLAGILFHIKKLGRYQKNMENHLWQDEGEVRSIEGSTTLVVGLGDIGSTFARKMEALGSTVYGIRRHQTPLPDYLAGLYGMEELDRLLPLADFVALSLPNSPATRKVMGKARLERMKSTALLINVGRGSAVDSDALTDALNAGIIGGAVLDVVHQEPLPRSIPSGRPGICCSPPTSPATTIFQRRNAGWWRWCWIIWTPISTGERCAMWWTGRAATGGSRLRNRHEITCTFWLALIKSSKTFVKMIFTIWPYLIQ